jgi:hypothetical protein
MSASRCCGVGVRSFLLLTVLAGCATTEGGPARLYSPADEVSLAQPILLKIESGYYQATTEADRLAARNEYIARRMYIIDVEYSAYEAALTSERQKFAFGADITSLALGTVGALTPVAATTRALSASSVAVGSTSGLYDKDLIIAKTIQIVEADMRAQRLTVATIILQRRSEPTATYPLSAALSDLEQYYLAGTMNSGLIQAAKDAGNNEADAAQAKALVVTYVPITALGNRILAFWNLSATNKTNVGKWLDANAQGMPLAFFLRSGQTALFQKIIKDLTIP